MPARHVLTDKQIANAKPAQGKNRYTLWDAVVPSLGLRVTEKGAKSFIVQRRMNGRQAMLTLGQYPALALIDARERAQDLLKDVTRGVDPRQNRPAPVTASGQRKDSFEGAVETYIKREVEKHRRPSTQLGIIRPLRKLITRWGTLPVSQIGPKEIIDLLDEIVDSGAPVSANRTYSVLRRFFRWCVERHLIANNPAAVVRKPSKEESRSRNLSDEELREVWLATGRMDWPFGPFIRMAMLTGQRRNEIAGMTRAELDEKTLQWVIPGARTKNGKEHIVPLAAPVLVILADAPRFGRDDEAEEDQRARPVFTTNGKTGVSGFSNAKERVDLEIMIARKHLAKVAGKDPERVKPLPAWTMHDLRRSCATGMGRLGILPHVIETVLNHSSGFRSGIAGVYQRHPYLAERRQALEAWAHHLANLPDQTGTPPNVVPLHKARRA